MAEQQRWVFPQTFEGLFVRGLDGRVTPQLKERLRAIGLDLDQKLQPAYPAEIWAEATAIAAREVYPNLEREAAERMLGRDFLRGYSETFIGRAMATAIRMLPPMRVLARMQRSFRTGNNYLETRFVEKAKTEAELWLNETHGMPGFTAGILEFGAGLLGLKDTKIEILQHDGHEVTYRVSWRDR